MLRLLKWLLLTICALTAVSALVLAVGVSRPLDPIPQFGKRPKTLFITAVTLIDVERGITLPNQTVRIDKGRISAIADGDGPIMFGNAMVIDGRGKFLIPGLWDAHVHTLAMSDRLHFPLMLANGITSARNMGDGCSWVSTLDCVPDAKQWQASAPAPHFSATASYHIEKLESGADARALVAALKTRGDTLIKIQLDEEEDPDASKFKAIVKASAELRIAVAGHVPASANLIDPIYAALVSIEHDTQLMPHCPPRQVQKCDLLLKTLAQRGTAYVPTHVASSGQEIALAQSAARDDAVLPYTSSAIGAVWQFYRFLHGVGTDQADLVRYKSDHRAALDLTARAHRAGVPILAGTDALDPFVLHGAALHDELAYLVRAGLSNADVLRAATVSPAQILGGAGQSGTLAVGQSADMVLLDSNPLSDISATKAIDTVIAKGIVYDPQERAAMMAFVKRQASRFAVTARAWWSLLGLGAT